MTISRREAYALETRQALIDSAMALFVEQGYSHTSIDEIVEKARVTKGAFYHHFKKGKKAIFIEVVETYVQETMEIVNAAAREASDDPWEAFCAGTEAYLDRVCNQGYCRVVFRDAPAVLDWERWREIDNKFTVRPVQLSFERLMRKGLIARQPTDLLTRAFFGLLAEVALYIIAADDIQQARDDASVLVGRFLEGLR